MAKFAPSSVSGNVVLFRPTALSLLISAPLFLSGCTSDCFDWRCPLDEADLGSYETFIAGQNSQDLSFGESEYRYRLVQWLGEKRYLEARDGNTKADYDRFLDFYKSIEGEAGPTLRVFAEIASARSSGEMTSADEPKPIFSKEDFIPKILPIEEADKDAQSIIAANPLITNDASPASDELTANTPSSSAQLSPESPLFAAIMAFAKPDDTDSGLDKDLKALLGAAAKQGDFKAAFQGIQKFATRDDAQAQYLLGRMHEDGVGTDQNYVQAIDWLDKAAAQNVEDAKTALLNMYEVGLGVPTSPEGLFQWHARAAELGNIAAQTQVGILYENGDGVAKNLNQAARWYRSAARQGDANAQFLLGWMYAEGQGVELDFIEAYAWFYLAKAQGLAEAARLLDMVGNELSPQQIKTAQRRADNKSS